MEHVPRTSSLKQMGPALGWGQAISSFALLLLAAAIWGLITRSVWVGVATIGLAIFGVIGGARRKESPVDQLVQFFLRGAFVAATYHYLLGH